jgi:hypothetical protein
MLGFEYVKDVYANDADFSNVYIACDKAAFGKFYKHDGYFLKKANCVCQIVQCMNYWCVRHMVGD